MVLESRRVLGRSLLVGGIALLVLLLLAVPVCAVSINYNTSSFNNGLGFFDNDIVMFPNSGGHNIYCIVQDRNCSQNTDNDTVKLLSPLDSSAYNIIRAHNYETEIVDAIVASDGYIYYDIWNGASGGLYRLKVRGITSSYLTNDTAWPNGNIATIATGDFGRIRESMGYVYYEDKANDRILRFDVTTGGSSPSLYFTLPDAANDEVMSFDVYDGELYFLVEDNLGGGDDIYLRAYYASNGSEKYSILVSGFSNGRYADRDIQYGGGNLYIGLNSLTGDDFINEIYSSVDGSLVGAWGYPNYDSDYVERTYSFFIGSVENVALVRNAYTIETIGTNDTGQSQESYPSIIDYDFSYVDAVYDPISNNSDIVVQYNIRANLYDNGYQAGFLEHPRDMFNEFDEDYNYVIELYQPDSSFSGNRYESIVLSYDGSLELLNDYYAYSIGSFSWGSPINGWVNGTWSLHLYEVNASTGYRSLLDTDTFIIQYSSTNQTAGEPELSPPSDSEEAVGRILESNYFYALLMVIVPAYAFFEKSGTLSGGCVGAGAGLSIAYLMGYLPQWMLILFAMCVILAFANHVSKQITRGD